MKLLHLGESNEFDEKNLNAFYCMILHISGF
jgi:hypothetical protein